MNITAESLPFQLLDAPEYTDICVHFEPVAELSKPPESAIYESGNYFADGNVYYCDDPAGMPYACLSAGEDGRTMWLEYVADYQDRFGYSQIILNHLGLETLLLKQQILLLHSSFIRLQNGSGVLFSAPSGTGKSTQAELWRKYRGADIINGDRAGLRKTGTHWTAWGLTYAGTSGIYRNESANIGCVVILKQAKENTIRRLKPSEAIRYLYPEITVHRWEKVAVDHATDLLIDMVSSVPVFMLECRPDEDAVSVLEKALEEVLR